MTTLHDVYQYQGNVYPRVYLDTSTTLDMDTILYQASSEQDANDYIERLLVNGYIDEHCSVYGYMCD